MTSIELNGVHLDYPIYTGRGRSLRNHLVKTVGGAIRRTDKDVVTIKALEDITISLRPGDRVALLGGNGAGKSTLLRVMAGILEPPVGSVKIVGRVSALLDMSMGLDVEATGYENIIMRSVFLGATFAEAQARAGEIEAFSGLGEYLEFPLRTYSAGMVVRLSVAISLSSTPEILVIDEGIGSADAEFAAKAKSRLLELVSRSKILVLATHAMEEAGNLCTRGIWLQEGRVKFDGALEHAIAEYRGTTRAPVLKVR